MNHTPATVAQFLADHAPQEFCSTCLASVLTLGVSLTTACQFCAARPEP